MAIEPIADVITGSEQPTPTAGSVARDTANGSAKARFFAGVASVAILGVFGTFAAAGLLIGMLPGWQGVSITSGSMQPGIIQGDLVLVSNAPSLLSEGRVITFTDPKAGGFTTHRIVSVNSDDTITTRGDANQVNDLFAVPVEEIVGAGRIIIPFVGLPADWAASGNYPLIALLFLASAGMVYLARFATSRKFDPWRDDHQ